MTRADYLIRLSQERILVLDGAMGTMIQRYGLSETDFPLESLLDSPTGPQFAMGCNDLLSITRPDIIYDIHSAYLHAGADIIETNTFGANRFSLREYALGDHVYDLNLAAVEVARMAVSDIEQEDEGRFAFIAGAIGPTGTSASFSPSVDDPAFREFTFSDFTAMYREQITALLDAHVDLLLVETVFDTLAAKAALTAALQLFAERGEAVPLMVSATFSDASQRTLSGQTLEAFIISLSSFSLFSLGLNCSTGAAQMIPLIRDLARWSPFRTSAHPNAGFPDNDGTYRQNASEMAALLEPVLQQGLLSIVGGCCGTTPQHIAYLAKAAAKGVPHIPSVLEPALRLSGWEPLVVPSVHPFITVGERANVAGSKKFARLIREGHFDEAMSIARSQVEQGAQMIDICMDDPLLEAPTMMVRFLRLIAADPVVARVPVMVDSSSWEVIQAALPELQGRGVVNSISLKEGEEVFLSKARYIDSMGAAAVVMLFDEQGQADTFARKCAIAERSYHLLVDAKILAPSSIIFDANILSIATGIDSHDGYARDFLLAVAWIKKRFPLVRTSGGLSNLSFAFRGNNALREAIHAVFLNLAVEVGLDMAIVNPAIEYLGYSVPAYAERIIREALLLEQGDGLSARTALIDLALSGSLEAGESVKAKENRELAWRTLCLDDRLTEMVVRGDDTYIAEDLQQTVDRDAVAVIEGPLMKGMSQVGTLFGEGKLFLPQVVRSARIMKKAVDFLKPRLPLSMEQTAHYAGTIVLATVKGDVHDIGKNIVSLVLRCNNFKVIDLGVMVPAQTIIQAAVEHHADMIGLSGLITPSLVEMAIVCRLCEQQGLHIPILIGGATTSEQHTAIKLAPLHPRLVLHTKDASHSVSVACQLVGVHREGFLAETMARYQGIAGQSPPVLPPLVDIQTAREKRFIKKQPAPTPLSYGIHVVDHVKLDDLIGAINWRMLSGAWRVPVVSDEAQRLEADARRLLETPSVKALFDSSMRAVVGIFPAVSKDETVMVFDPDRQQPMETFTFFRSQQFPQGASSLSLADFVMAGEGRPVDSIGLFAATAGLGVARFAENLRKEGEEYHALLVTMLADRLVEAFSGYLQARMADTWWGFGETASIRPAPGYPSAPDHSEKKKIFSILEATRHTGMVLSESFAMDPAASVCGFLFVGEDVRYFSLGKLGRDQLESYAQRKNLPFDSLESILALQNLGIVD